ncbi:MAG: rhomboid family intramembrane serine protease [Deltaproteobacteria bacterium]|nr:rhomboid family intramembrane serine protease [Deltaproteobacteria bacterium]
MIPIRDTTPSARYPMVNNLLIGINILVFLVEIAQGADMQGFMVTWGFVPAKLTNPRVAVHFSFLQQFGSFFSFMFLHGGFLHLLFNMWTLYIFGDNVEDRLGHVRYLAFYLVCGWASAFAHLVFNWDSTVPTVGASGAIAGVMGAYFLLYPGSRILTLIPVLFIPWFVEIPAFVFLGIWFLLQLLSAAGGGAGNVAWWAHVGGFVVGMALLRLFLRLPRAGVDRSVGRYTQRRSTPRLQVVRPMAAGNSDPNLYGHVFITPWEARNGAKKIVNIPWGFQKRLFTVVIPPGLSPGARLRLRGLGRITPDGGRGDMILDVRIADAR